MYFSQHVIQSVPPILGILGAETKLLKAGGEGVRIWDIFASRKVQGVGMEGYVPLLKSKCVVPLCCVTLILPSSLLRRKICEQSQCCVGQPHSQAQRGFGLGLGMYWHKPVQADCQERVDFFAANCLSAHLPGQRGCNPGFPDQHSEGRHRVCDRGREDVQYTEATPQLQKVTLCFCEM